MRDAKRYLFADGSLPDPERPPAPIKPVEKMRGGRFGSVDTHDLEEASEFLEPKMTPGAIEDEDDYQTLEDVKTVLHKPHSSASFAYDRVPWQLKVRKEVFSPAETLRSPLAVNLVFCQVVFDVFSPLCIRMTTSERSRMKTLLDEYDVDVNNVFSNKHKLSTKKNIIEMARELSVYFSRLYPISKPDHADQQISGGQQAGQQYLCVSHSGVKLVERQKGLPTDTLEVSGII